ncbi:UDP-N-acetylmuramate--L-alanine ligase [Candidatus Gracilibacteria bacterium]|nr:UDP-N-acetylmuramate--L-alanine ligase [Candidatus Gracilibacteria bacterium]
MQKVYFIGIGGIGISAVARYYKQNGWQVFGSDKYDSELISTLKSEGMNIIVGEDLERISKEIDLVIFTEAVPNTQTEIIKARGLGIKTISYPESLALISNDKKLIAISGSHGKSTTTSMISIMLKNSSSGVNAVIGTILKEFDNKNAYFSSSEYFVIEACEYKRSFLNYSPYIGIITNIDLDHLDYYHDLTDYESAFNDFISNIKSGGYAILNASCISSMKFYGLRNDISYILINENDFLFLDVNGNKEITKFPKFALQVPGDHIKFDAKIAYVVGIILNLNSKEIINSLENYTGVWRRSEIVGTTINGNILMSDYGHHPTEIRLTLDAIKEKYSDKKLFIVFQPHQYNRTLNLIDGFVKCFESADKLVIPNIYESRDTWEDKNKLDTNMLVELINHPNKSDGLGLENTLKLIQEYDIENPNSSIILLQGAGNVDNLRYEIGLIK